VEGGLGSRGLVAAAIHDHPVKADPLQRSRDASGNRTLEGKRNGGRRKLDPRQFAVVPHAGALEAHLPKRGLSGFHLFLNSQGRSLRPDRFDPFSIDYQELKANPPGLADRLRLAMLSNGVDVTGWPGGTISAVHGERELTDTAEAFRESLRMLKAEDAI